MKSFKSFLLGLSLGLIAFTGPHTASAQISSIEKQQIEAFSSQGNKEKEIAFKGRGLKDFQRTTVFDNAVKMRSISENPALEAKLGAQKQTGVNIGIDNLDTIATLRNTTWGTTTMLDDKTALNFTQDFTVSFTISGGQRYYKATTITLLDENFEPTKSITINTPDTTMTISVLDAFSRNFFNNDDKIEFLVQVHGFDPTMWSMGPSGCRDTLLLVNEDGEILRRYGNVGSADIHKVGYDNRLITMRPPYDELYDSIQLKVYDAKENDVTASLFTVEIADDLMAYSAGPVFEYEELGGKNYYVSSFYEKSFDSALNPENPVIRKNNKFIVRLFDANTFEIAKDIKLDIIGQDTHEWSMADLYNFQEMYMSTNIFNQDTLIEIIYGVGRYMVNCDCVKTDLYLVNEKGEVLKEMLKQTAGTQKLQSLTGQTEEYAVFRGGDGKIEAITMYEMPGMKENASFPSLYNGEVLSLSFNRVLDENGKRNYIFALGSGESADNTVYAGIVYYDVKGKKTKHVRIDVGIDVALVSPILDESTVNPYIVNGDSEREYFLYGKEFDESGAIHNYFAIASGEGKILYKWCNMSSYGEFSMAGFSPNKTQTKTETLFVSFSDPEEIKAESTTFIYKLPLQPTTLKGEGTKTNPYIITTPVELDLVRNNNEAYYILGNDIDMSDYTGLNGAGFLPICEDYANPFKGKVDGKNHTIKNLHIKSNYMSVGLFSNLADSGTVQNLFLKDAIIESTNGSSIGSIAGTLTNYAKIENCHVEAEVNIEANASAVGGLVGQGDSFSEVQQCSFTGSVSALQSSATGGIVGSTKTSTQIKACYSSGYVVGRGSVGGISGSLVRDGAAISCYSTMDVEGGSDIGGIAGVAGGVIRYSYAKGNVKGDKKYDNWGDRVGGIAGDIYGSVFKNVALNTIITAQSGFARIGQGFNNENLQCMDSNFAINTMKIGLLGEEAVLPGDDTESKKDLTNGESKNIGELNQVFYEKIGWGFGTSIAAPWKMVGEYPHLWFEYNVRGVELSAKTITLNINDTATLYATVQPATAENKSVIWESSDPTIATVDQQGKLKAKKKGQVTITVITDEGDFTQICKLTVVQPITSIQLSQKTINIAVEGIKILKATVLPADADNKRLSWISTDYATVDVVDGNILGVKVGKALIIVTGDGGAIADTCEVTVVVPVERVILDPAELNIKVGQTAKINALVRPTEATVKTVRWESSNESIATVDADGTVLGIGKGAAIVKAISVENEKISAICEVNVEGVSNENKEQNTFNVYISGQVLHIDANVSIEKVFICDMLGRSIYTANTSSNVVEVSMQEYPDGVYLVKANLNGGVVKSVKIKK